MFILHFLPATNKLNKLLSNSSILGFTIYLPSTYPICVAHTGPSNGNPAAITDKEDHTIVATSISIF